MIKVVKRCEFPMSDGFKCNNPFQVSSARTGRKYCDDHIGNEKRQPEKYSENKLVNSTNVHAQAANDIAMREWVMEKMKAEKKAENRIVKLETEILRLGKLIERSEGNKKTLTTIVKQEFKSPTTINMIENILVKNLRKSNLRLEELKTRIVILENKNGDEEE